MKIHLIQGMQNRFSLVLFSEQMNRVNIEGRDIVVKLLNWRCPASHTLVLHKTGTYIIVFIVIRGLFHEDLLESWTLSGDCWIIHLMLELFLLISYVGLERIVRGSLIFHSWSNHKQTVNHGFTITHFGKDTRVVSVVCL